MRLLLFSSVLPDQLKTTSGALDYAHFTTPATMQFTISIKIH